MASRYPLKSFRLNCVIRLLVLTATISLLACLLVRAGFYFSPLVIGALVIYQVYSLIHYVEATNRYLTDFLATIEYEDFARSFKVEKRGPSFDELKSAFNKVIGLFRTIRSEKEEQRHFLQSIIQHIGISLVAFDQDGTVELINNAAKRLFKVGRLASVKSLETIDRQLAQSLVALKPGKQISIKARIHDESVQLSVHATEVRLGKRMVTLVSIQNIQSELEEQEMEAWQNLIRVMTHEIMNSITPIASLAATANLRLKDGRLSVDNSVLDGDSEGLIQDVRQAVETIHRRSTGLIRFVDSYRNLTQIPKPDFKIAPVRDLLENAQRLLHDDIAECDVSIAVSVDPESLTVMADGELITQVLINLVKNALRSTRNRERGRIELRAYTGRFGRTEIQVEDNGTGINEDAVDKVFIPFFTTNPEGTGIGLSLSRQIMRLHGATITVHSEPNQRTIFTLRF